MIKNLDLADSFYEYGIEGFAFLIKYNESISHFGSEHSLEEFFLGSKQRRNLSMLFKKMGEMEWSKFYQFKSDYNKSFLSRLCDNCREIFKHDPLIIFSIAGYIKALGRNYLRDDFKEIDQFSEETNSYQLLIRILWKDIFLDKEWEFGSLISEDCYDYI